MIDDRVREEIEKQEKIILKQEEEIKKLTDMWNGLQERYKGYENHEYFKYMFKNIKELEQQVRGDDL